MFGKLQHKVGGFWVPNKFGIRAFMVSTRMEGRIEGLEKTMTEVQEEIGSVRDYLGQLRDWMHKKDERDVEILQHVKGKSAVQTDPIMDTDNGREQQQSQR